MNEISRNLTRRKKTGNRARSTRPSTLLSTDSVAPVMLNIPLKPPSATSQDPPIAQPHISNFHQQTPSNSASRPHRHSEKIKRALELLKTLSDQAVSPVPVEEKPDQAEDDQPEEVSSTSLYCVNGTERSMKYNRES